MTPITTPHSATRRRAFAALLVAFVLLTMSWEKKAALMSRRGAAFSSFSESRGGATAVMSLGEASGGGYADKSPNSPSVVLASLGQGDTPDNRKIVRHGSLDLLVNDFGQSVGQIGSLVSALGGFVEK